MNEQTPPDESKAAVGQSALNVELGGWLPIETAPKDGSAVLVSNGRGVWAAKYKSVFQSGYKPNCVWFCLMLNRDYMPERFKVGKPTHWMPLPESPNASAKGPASAGPA